MGATHRYLCHDVPVGDEPWKYDAQIASKFITVRVLEKMCDPEFEDGHRLMRYIHGISEDAIHRDHVFEREAHELLMRGGSIDTIRLCNGPAKRQSKTFRCQTSEEYSSLIRRSCQRIHCQRAHTTFLACLTTPRSMFFTIHTRNGAGC